MTPKPKHIRPSEHIMIEQDWTGEWIATLSSYDGPESPIGRGENPIEACEMLFEAINWEMSA